MALSCQIPESENTAKSSALWCSPRKSNVIKPACFWVWFCRFYICQHCNRCAKSWVISHSTLFGIKLLRNKGQSICIILNPSTRLNTSSNLFSLSYRNAQKIKGLASVPCQNRCFVAQTSFWKKKNSRKRRFISSKIIFSFHTHSDKKHPVNSIRQTQQQNEEQKSNTNYLETTKGEEEIASSAFPNPSPTVRRTNKQTNLVQFLPSPFAALASQKVSSYDVS